MTNQVTAGREWRQAREEGYIQHLPSGKVVRLRPVSPDQLIVLGNVPDRLTPLVLRMVYEGSDAELMDAFTEPNTTAAEARESIELFNVVCRLAFVAPRIIENPQADDEISIDDVSLADRGFVFRLATGPAELLRTFRWQATEAVDDLSDGEGDAQPTE